MLEKLRLTTNAIHISPLACGIVHEMLKSVRYRHTERAEVVFLPQTVPIPEPSANNKLKRREGSG